MKGKGFVIMDLRKIIKGALLTSIMTCSISTLAFADEVKEIEAFPEIGVTSTIVEIVNEENTEPIELGRTADVVEVIEELGGTASSEVGAGLPFGDGTGDGRSLGQFRLTSYCSCRKCNGKWTGKPTAYGTSLEVGRTIAVDKRVIPLGSEVDINIPGKGWERFRAEDTGSAIKGKRIDVYVGNNHGDCYNPYYNGYAEVRLVK